LLSFRGGHNAQGGEGTLDASLPGGDHQPMRRDPSVSLALSLALTVLGCTRSGPTARIDPDTPGRAVASAPQRVASPSVPDGDLQAVVAGNTAFALDLYQELRGQGGNLFYSPFSISEALAMTWAGARGETAAQMAAALHFTLPGARLHPAEGALALALASCGQGAAGQDGGAFQLDVANSLWTQKGMLLATPFVDTLAEDYRANVQVVDFENAPDASRQSINAWVAAETAGKIQGLFPPSSIKPSTRLAIASAVYFDAAWATPFDPTLTSPATFTRGDGSTVVVPTMSLDHRLRYGAGSGYQAVELPYDGNSLSMVILLPNQGGLDALEASLTSARLGAILSGLGERQVDLTLPRFTLAQSFGLAPQLTALGMIDAFTSRADFSGINGTGGLQIDAVIHQAWVSVNETGTLAAAATGVGVGPTIAVVPVVVHVDHAFVFVIRDAGTGTVLFVGRVDDPSAS
jgi:serpin B